MNRIAALSLLAAALLTGAAVPPLPAAPGWSTVQSLPDARSLGTGTLLPDGSVLVGGGRAFSTVFSSCYRFNPATGTWSTAAAMPGGRISHGAVLLPTGKVLIAGGFDHSNFRSDCHLYDPGSDSWSATGSLSVARHASAMFLLKNGKVLLTGGGNFSGNHATCELYDPMTGAWTPTGSLLNSRESHRGGVLPDGRVFIGGGYSGGAPTATCEIYDPASGSWSLAASLPFGGLVTSITPLSSGKVLAAGGETGGASLRDSAVYDPAIDSWTGAGLMAEARGSHTATLLANGKVLVVGGGRSVPGGDTTPLASCELFDETAGTWSSAGSLSTGGRWEHPAVPLANGKVLVVAGYTYGSYTSACEVFDAEMSPVRLTWIEVAPAGSTIGVGATQAFTATGTYSDGSTAALAAGPGTWATKTSMPSPAYLMPCVDLGGYIFMFAGFNTATNNQFRAYHPATDAWIPKTSSIVSRGGSALAQVGGTIYLMAGNNGGGGESTIESYDPSSDTWSIAPGLLPRPRWHPIAGAIGTKIYVAGGFDGGTTHKSLDVYDTATNSWQMLSDMILARYAPGGAVVNGKFYVIGGASANTGQAFADVEMYDPVANTWVQKAPLPAPRYGGITVVLDGRIYFIGGNDATHTPSAIAAVYDVGTDTWTGLPSMPTARHGPGGGTFGGKIYVAGGTSVTTALTVNEEFTPGLGWSSSNPLYATIDSAGVATGHQIGATTIQATYQGVSGSTALNVVSLFPTFQNVPADVLGVQAVSPGGTAVSLTPPTATDYLGNALTVSSDDPGNFQVGSWVVTWNATDSQGRTSTATTTVEIIDTLPPVLSNIPGPFIVTQTAPLTPFLVPLPTASDNSDAAPDVVSSAPMFFPPGETVVQFIATDDFGNQSFARTSVRVELVLNSITVSPADPTIGVGQSLQFNATGSYSDGSSQTLGVWSTLADLPNARYPVGAAAAVVGGTIYLIGGGPGFQNSVYAYSPSTGAWTLKAAMPTPRQGLCVAAVGTTIYAIGGLAGFSNSSIVEAYDTQTDSWFALPSMPTARQWACAEVIDGVIYVVGGELYGPGTVLNTLEAFDTLTNTWTSKSPRPAAAKMAASGAINGKLYVAGGSNNSSIFTSLHEYDPVTDGWTAKPSMAVDRAVSAYGVVQGRFFVMGGASGASSTASSEVYDPATETWSPAEPLTFARSGPASAVHQGRLYVMGGHDGSSELTTVEAIAPGLLWSSSDPAVASIGSTGLAGGLQGGTTTITATSGAVSGSTTLTVGDTTIPLVGIVNDGPGADIQWQSSTTTITANWSGFSDPESGIASYEWAIGTSPGGTNIQPFTAVGLATSASNSSLTIQGGTTVYYVAVRATNGVGLTAIGLSNGVKRDLSAPATRPVRDGLLLTDLDFQSSASEISANWTDFVDNRSGIVGYEWAIGTTAGGSDVQGFVPVGLATSATATGLSLGQGTEYFVTVRATNGAGLTATRSSDGVVVDLTPPTAGQVHDGIGQDIQFQTSITTISGDWSGFADAESQIARYEWAIGTSAGGSDLQGFVSTGTTTRGTNAALSLAHGVTYYVTVRAYNRAGLYTELSSNGVTVDTTGPAFGAIADGYITPNQIFANWDPVTDPESGIVRLRWAIGTTPGGTDVRGFQNLAVTATSAQRGVGPLVAGRTYYVTLEATNGAGTVTLLVSDGVTYP